MGVVGLARCEVAITEPMAPAQHAPVSRLPAQCAVVVLARLAGALVRVGNRFAAQSQEGVMAEEKEKIEEGDRVNVYFEGCPCLLDVEVLYTPQATGDSWHLRNANGRLYYVQMFSLMELKTPPEEMEPEPENDIPF